MGNSASPHKISGGFAIIIVGASTAYRPAEGSNVKLRQSGESGQPQALSLVAVVGTLHYQCAAGRVQRWEISVTAVVSHNHYFGWQPQA